VKEWMMKILMTGFTPRAVNSDKLLYSIMSNVAVIRKGLERAGHTVDHRIVEVEEPRKDRYDVALVGIAVPQSHSSRFVFSALWAAEVFGPERTRWYVDDWLLHQFQSQVESAVREPEKRFYSLDNRYNYNIAKRHTETWIKWYKFMGRSKFNLLMPCFPWSKPRLLLPKLPHINPVIFDPTPMALTDPEVLCGSSTPVKLALVPPEQRERRWTLAALRDIKDWFAKNRFDWPVDQYGNKRQQQPIVTERELLDIYCKNWGIIGAPYAAVAAGGGWRARYIHSAVTRSILFLDPQEGTTAGKPYNLFRTKVESASTDELANIANAQYDHLMANTWSLDQLTENLDNYVKVN
jgi:hypothetical protein